MCDPSALPPELFDTILDYLSPDVSVAPPALADDHKWDQLADLSACNLVSRTWYSSTLPKLYRAFRFQGHLHSFWRLWKFVRTVVENPSLAGLVRSLDLGEYYDCYIPPPEKLTRAEERQRRRENRDMHETAHRIGILTAELTEALREKDHGPYQLLLISILPNLSKLYLSSNGRYSDWRLQLCDMLDVRHLLRKLKVAMWYPLDGIPYFDTFDERGVYHVTHDFFFLPSLQELVLFELDLCLDGSALPDPDFHPSTYRTSPVQKLTICPRRDHTACSPGTREYLQDILQLPRSLVSLTLWMPRQRKIERNGFESLLTGDQLWQILYHSRDSLECLDIYNVDASVDQERIQQNSPLGQLCEFKRLKTLRIQANFLVGGICGITRAPFRLRDTLPESLQSLNFYDVDKWIPDLLEQCTEWAGKAYRLKFRCLTLQRREYRVNTETILSGSSLEKSLPKSDY